MSKIAVLSVPAYGHLIPMLGVIAELVRRGNDVTVYNDPALEPLIAGTGARFVAYPSAIGPTDFPRVLKDGNLIAAYEMILAATPTLTDFCLERLGADRPDVVVFDSIAMWGYIATRTLKLRSVGESPIFVFEFLRHLLGWHEFWGHARRFMPRFHRLAWRWSQLLRYGLRNLPFDIPLIPLRGDRTIVLTSRELHPKSPIFSDPRWAFVGASIDARTRNDPFDFSRLDGRPVILISMGTIHFGHDEFFRTCMEAFTDYPAQFLLAAGPGSDPDRFENVPENFIIQATFPQLPVLERTRLFITHAGLGSVHEALWHGVPIVAVPQHFEQLRNATAATSRGAGIVLDGECYGRPVTASQLRAAVNKVVSDPAYAGAAKALGQSLRDGGGFAAAADIIEAVAEKR